MIVQIIGWFALISFCITFPIHSLATFISKEYMEKYGSNNSRNIALFLICAAICFK